MVEQNKSGFLNNYIVKKEIMEDITTLIKGIREFNEATGGAVSKTVVMAAKISALVLLLNKLKNLFLKLKKNLKNTVRSLLKENKK